MGSSPTRRTRQLKALLLDLDGTLLDHRRAADAAIASWAATLVPAVPPELPTTWAAWEEHHVSRAERGEVTWQEQRRHRLRALFGHLGLPDAPDAILDGHFAEFLTHYERSWTAYDDVAAAFESWGCAGVQIGILTNGVQHQQRRKLEALGVLDAVEVVVALDDLGVGKPDPRVYALACERLGRSAPEVVYVGDDVVRDAIGAQRAGLVGVWLDRFGLPVPDGVDLVVRSLDEVLSLLHHEG